MASVQVANMATFGNTRTKDVFSRHNYHSIQAADKATPVQVDTIYHGITAANSAASIGTNTQYEIVKMSAVESAADSTAGRLDMYINDGSAALAGVKVAELSSANAKFVASTLSADFGSSYSAAFTGGSAAGNVTQTFSTGSSSSVVLAATGSDLKVTAGTTRATGEITVDGDRINWAQSDGGSNYKKSAANMEYIYTHNAGTPNTSTGVVNFNLDAQNVLSNQMKTGAFNFNSFNSAGAVEPVLAIGAGAAAGGQSVVFSNSAVGIGQAPGGTPTAGYALDVVGKQRVTSDLSVLGNLYVSGVTTTVNSSALTVQDLTVDMAYNVTDPTLFNGAGIIAGSGSSAVNLLYNDTLKAWNSSINFNVPDTFDYLIAGGANHSAGTGMTLSSAGLDFGSGDATIKFGDAATITKNGLTGGDGFSVNFGTHWRWISETINGDVYLSAQYSTDGGSTYATKFSISS